MMQSAPDREDGGKPFAEESLRRTKKVTFSLVNEIYDVLHLQDLTDEEINARWRSEEEHLETKRAYTVIVRLMMKTCDGFVEDDEENCTRGLGTFDSFVR